MNGESRQFRRLQVKIPVRVARKESPTVFFDGEIQDISERGASIRCNSTLQRGDQVLLDISIESMVKVEASVLENDMPVSQPTDYTLPTLSNVAWTHDNGTVIGVEFRGLAPEKKQKITQLMAYYDTLSKAGVSFS